MRIAAHRRHLEHRVLEGELRFLRHHRHPPRDDRAGHRAEIGAVEHDAPSGRTQQARRAAEAASSCRSRSDRGCRRGPRARRCALTPSSTGGAACDRRTRRRSAARPALTHRAPDLRRRIRCWWHVPARERAAGARTPGTTVTTVWYSPRSPHGSTSRATNSSSRSSARSRPRNDSSSLLDRTVTIRARVPDARKLAIEIGRRLLPQRLDRCEAASGAQPLGPFAMLVEQDVAEDDVGDAHRRRSLPARDRTRRRRCPTCTSA